VMTRVGPGREIRIADLPMKSHERLFAERVPLPPEMRNTIQPTKRFDYAHLAEGVEAWGFRAMQVRGTPMSREEVADAWYHDEYAPVVEMLKEAGLCTERTDTDAYIAVVTLRYLLLRTHEWDEEILEALKQEMREPSSDDSEVRRLRQALE
jgi:hypothetical protein